MIRLRHRVERKIAHLKVGPTKTICRDKLANRFLKMCYLHAVNFWL